MKSLVALRTLASTAFAGGPVDVTIAPGLDHRSRLFVADLAHPYNFPTPYARRMAELKAEIDAVATIRVLDPLTAGGAVERPAIKLASHPWRPVGDLTEYDRGGGVIWLRHELDPWIRDAEFARRQAAYEAAVESYKAECSAIQCRWNAAHPYRSTYLGEFDTRVVRDPVTGLLCRVAPLYPRTPPEPSYPEPFDTVRFMPARLLPPVEARRPE